MSGRPWSFTPQCPLSPRAWAIRRLPVETFVAQFERRRYGRSEPLDPHHMDAVEVAAFPFRHLIRIAAILLHERVRQQRTHRVLPRHQHGGIAINRRIELPPQIADP